MTQPTVWRKPRKCDNSSGNCVEVAEVSNTVAVRDSKDPNGAVLVYTKPEFGAFLDSAKAGYYDDLI